MIFHDLHPEPDSFFQEVQRGLEKQPKAIPPKFFYDQKGSEIFNNITRLPEYYLTEAELQILRNQGDEIGTTLKENLVVIEYGCGNSVKIHQLLEHLRSPQAYLAIDISRGPLIKLTRDLDQAHENLEVIAVCADFTQPLDLPLNGKHQALPRLAFFPGSSIGNFDPPFAKRFLQTVGNEVGPGGGLLIGVDLKKETQVLHQAYNDSQGFTEAFNKNLLRRINRELDAKFDERKFKHRAFYNQKFGRIEMHLESLEEQTVPLGKRKIRFSPGETIHTENSYKYSIEEFQVLAESAGWTARAVWTDEADLFSVQYFQKF